MLVTIFLLNDSGSCSFTFCAVRLFLGIVSELSLYIIQLFQMAYIISDLLQKYTRA